MAQNFPTLVLEHHSYHSIFKQLEQEQVLLRYQIYVLFDRNRLQMHLISKSQSTMVCEYKDEVVVSADDDHSPSRDYFQYSNFL